MPSAGKAPPRIAVVDHGAGNLVSIAQGLEAAGGAPVLAIGPSDLAGCDAIVLPGVGATGAAMNKLRRAGMVEPLQEAAVPLLGICVGLQLFFDVSEEDGGPCLGIVPGRVERISRAPRLPHIGWNDVALAAPPDPLFAGLGKAPTFYFVHSFAPAPADPATVIATADYGGRFVAAVRHRNRVGVQFHPERSGRAGLATLANFVRSIAESRHAA